MGDELDGDEKEKLFKDILVAIDHFDKQYQGST